MEDPVGYSWIIYMSSTLIKVVYSWRSSQIRMQDARCEQAFVGSVSTATATATVSCAFLVKICQRPAASWGQFIVRVGAVSGCTSRYPGHGWVSQKGKASIPELRLGAFCRAGWALTRSVSGQACHGEGCVSMEATLCHSTCMYSYCTLCASSMSL